MARGSHSINKRQDAQQATQKKKGLSAKTKVLIVVLSVLVAAGIAAGICFALGLFTPEVTVRFESNGGSAVEDVTVKSGTYIDSPDYPSRADYAFDEWYYESDFRTVVKWPLCVEKDMTLYAKWNEVEKAVKEEYATAAKDVSELVVCIDPGHGGSTDSTPEAVSPYSSATAPVEPGGASGNKSGTESSVNLAISKLLKADLEAKGVQVVMVREDNSTTMGCKERAQIANDADADLFIRIHCDSAGSSASGFYTLEPSSTAGYQKDNNMYEKSQQIGTAMHESIVKALGTGSRGIDKRSDLSGFNWCKGPCVLFEVANMDNTSEDALLATTEFKSKIAQAIADATISALSSK